MAVPTIVSKTLAADGLTLSILWSEAVNVGVTAATLLHPNAVTANYASGNATPTLVYTSAVAMFEDERVGLTINAGDVTSVSSAEENDQVTNSLITNQSTIAVPPLRALNGGDRRSRAELTRLIGRR